VAIYNDTDGTCRLFSGSLNVWMTVTLLTAKTDVVTLVRGSPASFSLTAAGRYQRQLPTGNYVVCSEKAACTSIALAAPGVFSINIQYQPLGRGIFVFEPGKTQVRAGQVFEIQWRGHRRTPQRPSRCVIAV